MHINSFFFSTVLSLVHLFVHFHYHQHNFSVFFLFNGLNRFKPDDRSTDTTTNNNTHDRRFTKHDNFTTYLICTTIIWICSTNITSSFFLLNTKNMMYLCKSIQNPL